jgi:hypothetical protein
VPLSESDLLEVQRIARAYSDAEARILARITASLAAGIDAPDWETRTLGRVQRLREEAANELLSVDENAAREIARRTQGLYADSAASMYADIGRGLEPQEIASSTQRSAVRRIAAEMSQAQAGARTALLRSTFDAYRDVVGNVVQSVVARGESKRAALTRATREFFERGLPAFTDKSGRRWNIQDYTNMAVRTGFAAAQIQGHEDALDAAGLDLVIIQPGPRACSICDRWARMVLSRSGARAGTYWMDSAVTGQGMNVKVDGSLAEARRAGFQHPNCRCSLRAFIPGATKRSEIERPPWDEEGYKRQQQQRGHERGVRDAKMRLARAQGLGDPKATAEAKALLRRRQAGLRDHLAANPYLKRRSDREQILAKPGGMTPEAPSTPKPPAPAPVQTERIAEAARQEVLRETVDARPAAEAELMARFTRRDEPEPLDVIVTKSNPGGDARIDRNYLTNCHYVVGAVEMRARGYDVVARPTVASLGRFERQIEDDWEGDRKFSYLRESRLQAESKSSQQAGKYKGFSVIDWIDDETSEMPVGARGYVTGAWARGGGGHIWNWEKTATGIVYHEGQIRDHGSDRARANVLSLKRESAAIMRVDDLTPAPGLIPAMQSPDEFALDGEARLRNEIARVDERIATLEATLAGQRAEVADLQHIADAYAEWDRLRRRSRSRNTPIDERFALIGKMRELQAIWSADRNAAQTAVNRAAIVKGTEQAITKWKTERRRLARELKAMT